MSQEPWNEEIYQSTESRRSRLAKGSSSTRVLSILAVLFLFIVIITTIAMVYLSHGGSKTDATQEFYNSNSTAAVASSTKADVSAASTSSQPSGSSAPASEPSSSSAEDTTQSSTAVAGETIAVQAGEGRDMIAARAGISPQELERLNPDKMTGPGGTWWANPGDLVKIK
ncbi:SAG1386/EF1546 family surface-associated protein [Streptococcus cuniculi]|uniref:LysM domain-containing protein n=1 Tax=Streptococcus cuniculi TaxID=1432788 RepID=A0A4Y9JCI4_9STRE|nr:SAG1386/EF1546 family surface-associated protein [Streptococcus cuniculi]MBF0778593.1 hypothetical protein [Streptococcus cuniculi]TFU97525.1 hypothetical protein E4T82_07630 [Streptococcus cuniculi]